MSSNPDQIVDEVEEFLTGVRPAPTSDRVLATLLFTDLVGSTEKANALGDAAWATLLGTHNAVVRSELARYSGEEIDTAGDGFLASFDGPARAIRCWSRHRRWSCASSGWTSAPACTRARSSAVRATSRAGLRFTSARGSCRSLAGGEVLVSSTTRDLVAGSGLEFEDRGEHELKGIEGRRRVFAGADASYARVVSETMSARLTSWIAARKVVTRSASSSTSTPARQSS